MVHSYLLHKDFIDWNQSFDVKQQSIYLMAGSTVFIVEVQSVLTHVYHERYIDVNTVHINHGR